MLQNLHYLCGSSASFQFEDTLQVTIGPLLQYYPKDMDVSKNGGTQQPLVFLLKMIILGCFGGTPIFGNTHLYIYIFISEYVNVSLPLVGPTHRISEFVKLVLVCMYWTLQSELSWPTQKASLPRGFSGKDLDSGKGTKMNCPGTFCIISLGCFLKLGWCGHQSRILVFKVYIYIYIEREIKPIISSALISGNSQTLLGSTSPNFKNLLEAHPYTRFWVKDLGQRCFSNFSGSPQDVAKECSIRTLLKKGIKQTKTAWCPEPKFQFEDKPASNHWPTTIILPNRERYIYIKHVDVSLPLVGPIHRISEFVKLVLVCMYWTLQSELSWPTQKASLPRGFSRMDLDSGKGTKMNCPGTFCVISLGCFLKLGRCGHQSRILVFKVYI